MVCCQSNVADRLAVVAVMLLAVSFGLDVKLSSLWPPRSVPVDEILKGRERMCVFLTRCHKSHIEASC
jgi:hypothetical protein